MLVGRGLFADFWVFSVLGALVHLSAALAYLSGSSSAVDELLRATRNTCATNASNEAQENLEDMAHFN